MAKKKKTRKLLSTIDAGVYNKLTLLHKRLKIPKSGIVELALTDFMARDPQLALFKDDISKAQ